MILWGCYIETQGTHYSRLQLQDPLIEDVPAGHDLQLV